jgi:hypothetical protein
MSRADRLVEALRAAGHKAALFEDAAKMPNEEIVQTIVICSLKSGSLTVGRWGVRPVRIVASYLDAQGADLAPFAAKLAEVMTP